MNRALTLDGKHPDVGIPAMRLDLFREEFGGRKPVDHDVVKLRAYFEPRGEVVLWEGEPLW